MDNLTSSQQVALSKLEKRGFVVSRIRQFEGESAPTVFLSKRVRLGMRLAQIDPDASVNGNVDVDAEIRNLLNA